MRRERNNSTTLAWRYYENGRQYNNRLTPNQYTMVSANAEFMAGNQWINLPQSEAVRRLPHPTFNILKRVASLFVAQLTSSGAAVHFEPLAYYDGSNLADPDSDAAQVAGAEVENLFEKFGMEYRIREALFDGAQSGDYCAHFYFDPEERPYGGAFGDYRGEIKMELVDGINVMFGNPATPVVERQPYILIVGRAPAAQLREEFRRNHKKEEWGQAMQICPDGDTGDQIGSGGKTELTDDNGNGKCLYLYLYTKAAGKNGEETVHVTKATRTATIFEDVDTGLSCYPVAWGNWERQKNQYHGRSLVTGLIPNQIAINTLFAMAIKQMMATGTPTILYDADKIPGWDNTIGKTIGVRNLLPGQGVNQVATTIGPADMSQQIMVLIDKVLACTKECIGVTDAQLGNVRPDNTSAILVLQSNSAVPLENPRAGLYEWLDSIGRILLDMMGTYYGVRPVVREQAFEEPVTAPGGVPMLDKASGTMMTAKTGRKVLKEFDFSQLKHLWLNIRSDVGASSYYSEIAAAQTLDNLRRDGTMTLLQYLERIPDKLIPGKEALMQEVKDELSRQSGQPAGMGTTPGQMAQNDRATGSPAGQPAFEEESGGLPADAAEAYRKVKKEARTAARTGAV